MRIYSKKGQLDEETHDLELKFHLYKDNKELIYHSSGSLKMLWESFKFIRLLILKIHKV